MADVIRVLVVDDSAYVRKVVTQMLGRSPFLEVVGTARDGEEALEIARERNPDVITTDLNMPIMDGLSFVRAQMGQKPIPIVVISIADASGEQVLAALDAGAVDFVQKPTALATERLMDIADELVSKVKAAAAARGRTVAAPLQVPPPLPLKRNGATAVDLIVIGVSTGGPQGLKVVVPQLPFGLPVPVAIVMHMPIGYTELYAQKLDQQSPLHVVEAGEGQLVEAGMVFLAPAGRHLTFVRSGNDVVTHLDLRPLDTPHRPAVDVLFQSAAEVYNDRVLGVVLTGMGSDGRDGAAWIKARGGCILTESEETCVVYGMPRSVVEAGLSDAVIPLPRIARAIMERI